MDLFICINFINNIYNSFKIILYELHMEVLRLLNKYGGIED